MSTNLSPQEIADRVRATAQELERAQLAVSRTLIEHREDLLAVLRAVPQGDLRCEDIAGLQAAGSDPASQAAPAIADELEAALAGWDRASEAHLVAVRRSQEDLQRRKRQQEERQVVRTMIAGHLVEAVVLRREADPRRPGEEVLVCAFACHYHSRRRTLCLDLGAGWHIEWATACVRGCWRRCCAQTLPSLRRRAGNASTHRTRYGRGARHETRN